MIAVIQRVTHASVKVDDKIITHIHSGYVILLGVIGTDSEEDVEKMAEKIAHLRIMSDNDGKMNLSIRDTHDEILVVSQFTLAADTNGGRRPSFIKAAPGAQAQFFYERFISKLQSLGIVVRRGKFGAYCQLALVNDGPVTIILDTKQMS